VAQQVEQAIHVEILLRYHQKYKKGVILSSSRSGVLTLHLKAVNHLALFDIFSSVFHEGTEINRGAFFLIIIVDSITIKNITMILL